MSKTIRMMSEASFTENKGIDIDLYHGFYEKKSCFKDEILLTDSKWYVRMKKEWNGIKEFFKSQRNK